MVFDRHTCGKGVGNDGQVWPRHRGFQIRGGGAGTFAVSHRHPEERGALLCGSVEVIDQRQSDLGTCAQKYLRKRMPGPDVRDPDRRFDAAEIRLDGRQVAEVVPVPAGEDQRVDRTRSAEYFAPGPIQPPIVEMRLRFRKESPVHVRLQQLGPSGWYVDLPARIRTAGFEEENAILRVLRQPAGEHASSRPAPDDDVVVHGPESIPSPDTRQPTIRWSMYARLRNDMDQRETERLLNAIRDARAAGEPAALATVVRVRGSAYRREGTQMFVRRDRTYECALSGGCLEPAVADAASRVIAGGEPTVVSFDLADDSLWGLGIGCTGAVDIRIERINDDPMTNEWLEILERRESAVLVTPLSGVFGGLIVRDGMAAFGSLSDDEVQQEAVVRARQRLASADAESGPERVRGAELFFQVTTPPPDLVVFGAGHDAVPVAEFAWTLGFTVTIVDVREAFLARDRFVGATLIAAHFNHFAEKVRIERGSFVLVMNHHVERDRESLAFSLDSDACSIVVLGPRSRYEKLLSDLHKRHRTFDPERLARVRSPVGLALGAETPHEVAVSIVAEMLAIRRGFAGGFLSGSVRSLHRPEDEADLQELGRKFEDHRLGAVALEDGTSAMLQRGEFREQGASEQVWRRGHVAVSHADDRGVMRTMCAQYRAIFPGCDKRLIRQRKHRGVRLGQVLDGGAKGTSHPACVFRVDRMTDRQLFQGRQNTLVLIPDDHQHVVKAGVADLPYGPPHQRLAAKRKQQLLAPHSR
jgi:xanthine dehydrogenase accessory factor